LDLKVHRVI